MSGKCRVKDGIQYPDRPWTIFGPVSVGYLHRAVAQSAIGIISLEAHEFSLLLQHRQCLFAIPHRQNIECLLGQQCLGGQVADLAAGSSVPSSCRRSRERLGSSRTRIPRAERCASDRWLPFT